ncbi:YndM family protein [Bacillus sp. JJ722]|uniref:YndM family protein n=1 Tax=Bacillus sp. JJ722 TaxID=3122973 RepID=UPI002FFF0FFE
MKHIPAFLVKCVASFFILCLVLGYFYNMSYFEVFLITIVLSVFAYILGDMLILSRTNNIVATISDFVLAFFFTWGLSTTLTNDNNAFFIRSFFAAASLAIFEYFFHKYLVKKVFIDKEHMQQQKTTLRYQTEVSEEFHPIKTEELSNYHKPNE